jgi:uroporphyrin-III C-methyltransferase
MPRSGSGTLHSMGKVYFVGAGPGAADLITLRGAHCLAQAEVVLHDALIDLALRQHAPQARWVAVGKRGYGRSTEQAAINAQLVELAQRHATVVRLKGGDPSVFGRLEEELQTLRQAGIACEVVPGVTAALAAAADAQHPLTRRGRGRSLALTTAVTREGRVRAACSAETEVLYMAGHQLAELGASLQQAGWPAETPVLVVSQAGSAAARCSEHRVHDLAQAAARHAGQPTVVIVGAGASPLQATPEDTPESVPPARIHPH